MKITKKTPVIITIKGDGQLFKIRVPLWKAYYAMALIEKEEFEKPKLKEKNKGT